MFVVKRFFLLFWKDFSQNLELEGFRFRESLLEALCLLGDEVSNPDPDT